MNAQFDSGALRKHCALNDPDLELIRRTSEQQALSPRACHRILKVARTLADMDASEGIEATHLAEAISFSDRRHGKPGERAGMP